MRGTLITRRSASRNVPLVLTVTAVITMAVMILAVAVLDRAIPDLPPSYRGAATALGAYVVFRLLYPRIGRRSPDAGEEEVSWSVEDGGLVLDGRRIGLDRIRQVHVWPERDALGHPLGGWTANIETVRGERNALLRIPGTERAETALRELVEALGSTWPGA